MQNIPILFCLGFGVFFLASCELRQTLDMDSALFIRVPQSGPPAHREGPTLGWHFKPVVQGSQSSASCQQQREPLPGCWYLVYPVEQPRRNLTQSLFSLDRNRLQARRQMVSIAEATFARFGVYPQVVEPNLIFKPGSKTSKSSCDPRERVLDQVENANPVWPVGPKPDWHATKTHMPEARAEVARSGGHGRIRIGILDNGFDGSHCAFPAHVGYRSGNPALADAIGQLGCAISRCEAIDPTQLPADGHGTGTIGILAGRPTPVSSGAAKWTFSGAVPDAQVVPVRIAPWVTSLAAANMAYGIDYASRVEGCDVISMSHGGSPSLMWMDAINAAYDRGTVIVAAAGNYMNLPFINRGFPSPSTTVYPAACRRVLGVSGVTADNKPYSKTDYARLAIHLFNPRSWFLMRGCAGPDGRYRSLNPFDQSRSSIDSVQVEALGKLRAQQISAPTPNVPWLVASGKEKVAPVGQGRRSGVSAAGGGTSSATPQVAGAAALWLASNERQIRAAGQWRSWQKAEATIHALLLSAQRQSSGNPAKAEQDERTDLGAGVLDARAALRHDFASICRRTSPELSLRFPTAACGAPPDSYDGSLSVMNMLIPSERFPAHGEHALLDLHLRYNRPDQLAQALETLYYNDALLYRWRKGAMPLNGKSRSVWFNPLNWVLHPVTAVRRVMYFGDEPGLRAQAKSDAQRALRRAKKLP